MGDVSEQHLTGFGVTDVAIEDEFWSPRRHTVRTTTLDNVYARLEETGRLENFRLAAGDRGGEYNGRFYNDSDVYKWLEAASYALAIGGETPELRERVDNVVSLIEAAQQEDGYLNTYFQVVEPEQKWTNLHAMHELYCAGHLFEAAVAKHEVTGEERLLAVARDLADHIDRRFGPDGERGVPGHPEIELALVKLSRVTEEDRYLDLAQFFIDERGRPDSRLEEEVLDPASSGGHTMDWLVDEDGNYDGSYFQDHAPVRTQATVEGHAVRAMYLYSGMTDVARETGDESLVATLEQLWENMTTKRMYVTGGIGSTHEGERFTDDYDLPHDTSYAETCAALGSILWNHRMFEVTREARFGDVIDRTLHNALLAGLSFDGTKFFYSNPHEMGPEGHPLRDENSNRFADHRQGWFETACCPTNIPRLLLSLEKYIYAKATNNPELYVNLFIGSTVTTTIDGTTVELTQTTDYPWDGDVRLTISVASPTEFTLHVRIPDWATDPDVRVNGTRSDADRRNGFDAVTREWHDDDQLTVTFELPVHRLAAHPAVQDTAGKLAFQRGPTVYCLEGVDHDRPLHQLAVPVDGDVQAAFQPDLLEGVTKLEGTAYVPALTDWDDTLYQDIRDTNTELTRFTAIPYFGWGHRDSGAMRIWIRTADTH